MKMIEAIIRPFKLEVVVEALQELGIVGATISEVRGCGNEKVETSDASGLVPKFKIQTVVDDAICDEAVTAIIKAARTGRVGDGKVFVSEVQEAITIRTSEHLQPTPAYA